MFSSLFIIFIIIIFFLNRIILIDKVIHTLNVVKNCIDSKHTHHIFWGCLLPFGWCHKHPHRLSSSLTRPRGLSMCVRSLNWTRMILCCILHSTMSCPLGSWQLACNPMVGPRRSLIFSSPLYGSPTTRKVRFPKYKGENARAIYVREWKIKWLD